MTKEIIHNWCSMSDSELFDEIDTIRRKSGKRWFIRNISIECPGALKELFKRTSFLSSEREYSILARLYCLKNGINKQPICSNPDCSNPVGFGKHEFNRCCCHDCSVRDPITQMKSKNTCELRYGTQYSFQSDIIKDKIRKTLMDRYNVDNPQKNDAIRAKTRATNNIRYGGPAPACSKDVVSRMEQTCEERYGVSNFSYSPLFSEYHHKRIFHDNLYFDSSWEVKVYDFLKSTNIPFEYSPSISLPYEYCGKQHTYHPDFLVNGRIYEVKGDHFFKVDESGKEVMINPYRDPEWNDERYAYECGRYEAKHQCMIANGVVIIREEQVNNLEDIFSRGLNEDEVDQNM